MARTSSHRSSPRPFTLFLLVASFGILFAGCGGKEPEGIPQADSFSFTADDIAEVKKLMGNGTGAFIPRLELAPETEENSAPPVIDVGEIGKFNSIRESVETEEDVYRVTNAFLNVRSQPRVTAPQIDRLERSDTVELVEFVNNAWAKVKLSEEVEGYVSSRYISKLVTEEGMAKEKEKYEGLYFVNFAFLNVRKEADTASEKLGELPGQSFVRPLSMDDVWARIPFEDGDGYIAKQYLQPFSPNLLVRQGHFDLPIVHYRLSGEGVVDALPDHIAALKSNGMTIWTMRDLFNVLLKQEERDVRTNPNTVVLAVSEVSPDNVRQLSDALREAGAEATIFMQSQYLGTGGIDQRMVSTLLANGHDIQSGGHSGEDLRSLTNAQVELELSQSKQLIEQITNKKVFAVAYPIGGVNDRIARKSGEIGYLLGLGTNADVSFDRNQLLRLPSVVVKASTSPEDLVSIVAE